MGRMGVSPVAIEPLDAAFGAAVSGVTLSELAPGEAETIREAWIEFGLLIFREQFLSRAEQDDFARLFGDLEFTATALTNIRRDGAVREPSHALVKSLAGNEGWHHDSTYMPVQAKGAVFTAEIIPTEGGDTGFADMRAAYEALSDGDRSAIAELTARHSRRYSMERAGHHVSESETSTYALYGFDDAKSPLRPLVKIHPDTGRPNLVIGQHAFGVTGMSDDDSAALLDELNERASIPAHTYHHKWSVGDAILWDNRRLMHRATRHDPSEPRRMWHTRVAGDPTTETAINYLARS
jgi:alpha-ketoglutarate-dependent taurine dioxygenase